MSQTLFQKARVITMSNLHTLLDKIKGINTVGEYEQYIRDLQDARDSIDDLSAQNKGQKAFLMQSIATSEARAQKLDVDINTLLSDDDESNDRFATPLQVQLDAVNAQIASQKTELEGINQQVATLDQQVEALDLRLTEAKNGLERIRTMDRTTKAQEKAASALSGINIGDAPDVSGIESQMASRAAVAANSLERNIGRIAGSVGGVTPAQAAAEAALAARRKAIAAQKAAAAQQ